MIKLIKVEIFVDPDTPTIDSVQFEIIIPKDGSSYQKDLLKMMLIMLKHSIPEDAKCKIEHVLVHPDYSKENYCCGCDLCPTHGEELVINTMIDACDNIPKTDFNFDEFNDYDKKYKGVYIMYKEEIYDLLYTFAEKLRQEDYELCYFTNRTNENEDEMECSVDIIHKSKNN